MINLAEEIYAMVTRSNKLLAEAMDIERMRYDSPYAKNEGVERPVRRTESDNPSGKESTTFDS